MRRERCCSSGAAGEERVRSPTLIGDEPIERTREYRPRTTEPLDENGQGNSHLRFCFAAHRAVVDVDVELGLVRVVEIATAQDVGRAMNPLAVEGQIEGGIAQGLGLALMEEIQISDGRGAQPLLHGLPDPDDPRHAAGAEPTSSSSPQPEAPYGLNGVAEAPTVSSTPAIVAAIRDACGRPLTRVPVRPDDILGLT